MYFNILFGLGACLLTASAGPLQHRAPAETSLISDIVVPVTFTTVYVETVWELRTVTAGAAAASTSASSGPISSTPSGSPICTKTIEGAKGDTCWGVANSSSISVTALEALNPGVNCTNLQIGQYLCVAGIAAPVTSSTVPLVYTVLSPTIITSSNAHSTTSVAPIIASSTTQIPAPYTKSIVSTAPTALPTNSCNTKEVQSLVTSEMVEAIAGGPLSCAGKLASCRTSAQIAQGVSCAFARYNTTSPGEIASLLSLMMFESVNFTYNVNVSPGRPGQGTYAEMMFNFIYMYASSIPALRPKVTAFAKGLPESSLDNSTMNAVLDLLNEDDNYSMGSASWYLTSQCKPSVRAALQAGGDQIGPWMSYITDCVGTTLTADREAYFLRAEKAVGLLVSKNMY